MPHRTTSATKTCPKCSKEYPATADYFSRDKSRRDGMYSYCKGCVAEYQRANKENRAEYQRAYREANRESIAERTRAWYEANRQHIAEYRKTNAERIAERKRAWREANRESTLEYARNYHHANREHRAEYNREWYKANPEYGRAWRAANPERAKANLRRRRARKRNAEGNHTGKDIQAQYKAQRGKCYYCHTKVGDDYHVDHVTPLSRGGSNGPENIVIACPTCNLAKNDKLPSEWPEGGRLL